MTDVVQFAVLGLSVGSIYALLACGLVVVYRGSGIINLAQGAFAMLAAFLCTDVLNGRGWPTVLAVLVAVAASSGVGALTYAVVMHPLRRASPLVRVIASLGVLTIVTETVTLKYDVTQRATNGILPTEPISLGGVVFGSETIWLVATAVTVSGCLALLSRATRVGLAVTAAAENPVGAAALGWSSVALSALTWTVGGAIAGIAGVLVPSSTSGYFSVGSLSVLIVAGLATALLAEFRSFPLAVAGGWFIGIVQSEAVRYVDVTGVADAVPLVFIVLVLVVRGRGLPVRGTLTDRLPTVGNGRLHVGLIPLALAGVVLTRVGIDQDLMQAVVISAVLGIIALSVVVVTGYAGQLSLAQMSLAGVGAFVAGRLVSAHGWTLLPGLIAGVVAAGVAGVLIGLPALRTRGVNLTVVTFALGFAIYAVVFSSSSLTGGTAQTSITPQTILGIPVDPVLNLDNFAALCILVFVAVGIVVANLRRGRTGRRLLAVRSSERAAASIGVNVFAVKLYAFGIGAAIAGVGGVLYAFSYSTILYPQLFTPFASIAVVTVAVIGGVGRILGPAWGSLTVSGGIGVVLVGRLGGSFEQYVGLGGGVLLIVVLIASQNGIAPAVSSAGKAVASRVSSGDRTTHGRARPLATIPGGEVKPARVLPRRLEIRSLTQRFGGVTALADVSAVLEPGRVLGLLGPNGAGKTTLIDAISGYVRPTAGAVLLDGLEVTGWSVHRRVRHGLSRTFQALELFDDLSVRENLLAACERRNALAFITDLVRPGVPALTPTAVAAVQELALDNVLDSLPTELSYGQRRLVAIARAVASGPSVLLLDEPGAGLDQVETKELGRLVRRLVDDWGMAVLLIEHDVTTLLSVSDDVLVLDFGQQIFHGLPGDVTSDERVRTAYLGAPVPPQPDRSSPTSYDSKPQMERK